MKIREMQQKIEKKFFIFKIIAFESGASNSPQSRIGYLSSAVNVLTTIPKILHITKRNVFEIIFY